MSAEAAKLRVLVVEDEGIIAMLIEDMLVDLGHEVAALASGMEDGLALARTARFDFAIIDVNLDGKLSYPIADVLKQRGIPFAFATGYGESGLDPAYRGAPILAKPFVEDDVRRVLPPMPGRG